MKRPREILLVRHQAANPKLDKMRRGVVADLTLRPARPGEMLVRLLLKLWRELIWPCRRIWTGLAAVWLGIAVVNLSHPDHREIVTAKSTISPGEMRLALQEQHRVLAEIIGPILPLSPADPPRRPNNQPRSQLRSVAMA